MSNGANWEPPRSHPAPPPSEGAVPTTVDSGTAASGGPSSRSRGALVAAIVGVVALLGASAFAIVRIAGSDSAGGADTPEAAGQALLAAVENGDVLGVVDVLLPGERETIRAPLTDLVAELTRIDVLSEDADLSSIGGVDIEFEDERVEIDPTNVDDIVNLRMGGRVSGSIDGEALPIGDLILDNTDAEPSELTTESTEAEEFEFPLTTVRKGDRWYVSAFYTIAELARNDLDEPMDIPAKGVQAVGGASPEDAMDNMIDGIEALDLEGVIGALNPDEFEALQRYAPLFVDDAQRELDDADAAITFADSDYTVSGSGDTRAVSIDYLRVNVESEVDPGTVTLEDGCWTIEAGGDTVNSCRLAEDLPELDDMFEDPEPVRTLIAAFQAAFDDYKNPGFSVKQVDGAWFLSPIATTAEQLLAVIRAVSRDEIEDLQAAIEEAMETMDGDDFDTGQLVPGGNLLDDYSNPNDETVTTSETVPSDDPLTPTGTAPTEACFGENDAELASRCFQELVDAGEIEPFAVPTYLRFPECGLVEIYWSGDYFALPDDEFVALVEETAPCLREKVESGELDERDLPLEFANPECLDGRNWYTALDDDAYNDAFNECVAQ
ncbi:MAG: hypothetical protein ACR2HQ_12165 [Ilumatobacteraceae bacterium]